MAHLLKGKTISKTITEKNRDRVEKLKARGIEPTLAIIRLGNDPGDLSYERGALKKAAETGVTVRRFLYSIMTSQKQLLAEIEKINQDPTIHGVLIFRPLPKHLDDRVICDALAPAKDMDGITSASLAGIFTQSGEGYPPCTAQAVMEMLDYINYDLTGKKVTVMGRSLVIGKPVAVMTLNKNATVTVLHSRTTKEDFIAAGHNADVIITAMGQDNMVGRKIVGRDQIIIDVGINVDRRGRLRGDVDFDEVEERASTITPVPGGVGNVTTAVLMKHVIKAAERANPEEDN